MISKALLIDVHLLTTQLLSSQNLEPVTKHAPKTQPFSKFRNPQLVVNPGLGFGSDKVQEIDVFFGK